MSAEPFALPESTRAVALSLLKGECDLTAARTWAMDLWQGGQEDAETVALALIEEHEWLEAQRLLPRVAALAGLTDETMLARWVERDLLTRWLNRTFSDSTLIDAGYRVWVTLLERRIGETFGIYNWLGDQAQFELGEWDLQRLPPARVRAYVLHHLVKDGAFERAGLEPPPV